MLSVPLNPDIERRLSELSRRTGRSESDFARELIEGNIEDLEDRYLAEKAIEEGGPRLTSEQVRKELGLDDVGSRSALPTTVVPANAGTHTPRP
jgi:RHH-type rel operon transcriptional repressor/antitoxin RelB